MISPDGDTLGYGQNVNGWTATSPGRTATAYTLNPVQGIWTLMIVFGDPVAGNEVSQRYTGDIVFNDVRVSAARLPDSRSVKLAPGTSVTVPVTITNNGGALEDFFVDARLNTTRTMTLASADLAQFLVVPVNQIPTWVVPTETSSISSLQTTSLPAMFDLGDGIGDPDIASASSGRGPMCADTESASYSPRGGTVTPGLWYAVPAECGPYPGPAPEGDVTISLTARTKPFDPAMASARGDIWQLAAVQPDEVPSFSPLVLGPGRTSTIDVTIKPSGRAGTVVSGTLYVDTYAVGLPTNTYATVAGDELAALPYTYTIK